MHSSTSLFIDHPLTNQEVGQRPHRGAGGGGEQTLLYDQQITQQLP